jgi:membrane protein
MVDRDGEVAGGIIAGALAYRLFIWLLPLALVAVVGLGVVSDSIEQSAEETAESVGLAGLVSSSVAGAASSSNRWYALLVGIPVLLFTTRSVLRVLIGAHRLIWADARSAVPRPTALATLRLLVLLLSLFLVGTLVTSAREWSETLGALSAVLVGLAYAGVWLLVTLRLPHRGARAIDLVPGALLFGLGAQLIQIVAAYVLEPWAISKQGTYGALGVAAALLFGIFLFCRLVVAAAILNATLWERQAPAG